MDLREFVRESLAAILDGVSDAKADGKKEVIAPHLAQDPSHKGPRDDYNRPLATIEFDVAVTVSRTAEIAGQAKGSLITVVSGGIDASMNTQNESVTRIKFAVPVRFKP